MMTADTEPSATTTQITMSAQPEEPDRNGAVELQESFPHNSSKSDENEKDNTNDSTDETPPAPPSSVPPRPKPQRQKTIRLSSKTRRSLRQWPRTIACCWGIFIPLNVLVVVSLIGGMLLGKLEMSSEIQSNNAFIRQKTFDAKFSNDLDSVLQQLPSLCLAFFSKNETIDMQALPDILQTIMTNQSLLDEEVASIPNEPVEQIQLDNLNFNLIPGNKTIQEMAQFFAACGQAGGVFRDKWRVLFVSPDSEDVEDLSFNYIRCVNRSSPLAFNLIVIPDEQDQFDVLPSTQGALFEESWLKSRRELEQEYRQMEEYSELEALTKSYEDATGQEKCAVNMPSAAWFWFTVMSTVGYGNQVPISWAGRLLTYTMGFISILLFGGVLATAGSIATHLFNDFLHRFKRRVSRPVKVFVWGCMWLLWMLVIAHQSTSYQETRLEEDFPLSDSYWFAYISTTTVGFGDYFLQPEGLFVGDLLGLWGTFLIGFVFLSSFLTELSQLFGSVVPNLADDLQRKLKYAYDNQVPEEIIRKSSKRKPVSFSDQEEERPKVDWSHPVLRGSSNHDYDQQPAQVATPTIYEDAEANNAAQEKGAEQQQQRQQEEQKQKQEEQKKQQAQQAQLDQEQEKQQQAQQLEQEKKKQQQAQQMEQEKKKQQQAQQLEQEKKKRHQAQLEQEKKKQQQAQKAAPPAAIPPPPQKAAPPAAIPPPQEAAPPAAIPSPQKAAPPAAIPPPQKAAPPAAAIPPQQKAVTFVNTKTDLVMVRAELYFKTTRWGPLGHGDPPISVMTYPGDQWYIVANGVYVKLFTVGESAEQKFTI